MRKDRIFAQIAAASSALGALIAGGRGGVWTGSGPMFGDRGRESTWSFNRLAEGACGRIVRARAEQRCRSLRLSGEHDAAIGCCRSFRHIGEARLAEEDLQLGRGPALAAGGVGEQHRVAGNG